jgi:hypothetical protein
MKLRRINSKLFRLKIFMIVGILTFLSISSIYSAEDSEYDDALMQCEFVNNNELILTYNLPEIVQTQIKNEEGVFTLLEIPNSGFTGEIGRPQLPMQTKLLAIPETGISLKVIESNVIESRNVGDIYPMQKPQPEDEIVEGFEFDESYYQQDVTIPENLVEITDIGNIRDIPFVRVVFNPVQYNPKKGMATIHDSITIKLTWDSDDKVKVESNFAQAPYYKLYQNVFFNWDEFKDEKIVEDISKPKGETRDSGCEYLIITHPDFYEQAMDLRDWKHVKGWITKVVNYTDIATSSEELCQYIQDAYDTWDPAPSYLLLIGDDEYIPTNYKYSAASDLWYATVNGTDYYADMFYGRISIDNVDQAEVVIQKILNYEQDPPSETTFYNNMVVAAYFQDDEQNGYETRRFVRTSEEIRDFLLVNDYEVERVYVTESYINPTHYNNGYYGNGEPLPDELLRPTFAWDGDADDIISAIEEGIFILNHRDHGYEDGWGDPHFDSNDVEGLTNGELLPVVFSINCLTGKFDSYECFSEIFLRKEDGGAVAVFGASRVSYSGYNDYLARGFYDAQWPDFDEDVGDNVHLYSLGEILNYGKYYMANTWGDSWGYERLTFELFHIFGDPTMQIWTSLPQELTVDHLSIVPYGESVFEVTVKSGENPVEGALVCMYQPNGDYAKGMTDQEGFVELEMNIEDPVEVQMTVSAHNHLNYQTAIQVGSSYPPDRPSVDGIGTGKPAKEYEYSAITNDPEEDQIYYLFDWGDGTQSEWLGPYDSGEEMTTTHSWSEVGNYSVKVRAKDVNDSISYWSEPFIVQLELPVLKIDRILGGMLKVTSTIENTGIAEAEDISWKISLDGGLILLGKESTGEVSTILSGNEETITSDTIIGFGPTTVIVEIDFPEGAVVRDQGGFIYLFYINVNPGGS